MSSKYQLKGLYANEKQYWVEQNDIFLEILCTDYEQYLYLDKGLEAEIDSFSMDEDTEIEAMFNAAIKFMDNRMKLNEIYKEKMQIAAANYRNISEIQKNPINIGQ